MASRPICQRCGNMYAKEGAPFPLCADCIAQGYTNKRYNVTVTIRMYAVDSEAEVQQRIADMFEEMPDVEVRGIGGSWGWYRAIPQMEMSDVVRIK